MSLRDKPVEDVELTEYELSQNEPRVNSLQLKEPLDDEGTGTPPPPVVLRLPSSANVLVGTIISTTIMVCLIDALQFNTFPVGFAHYKTAATVGATMTFMGLAAALPLVLLKSFYPPGRKDMTTELMWIGFQSCIGSALFGLLMYGLAFAWGLDPNFMFPQMQSFQPTHDLLERGRAIVPSDSPIHPWLSLTFLVLWPLVVVLYCLVRAVVGRAIERLSTQGQRVIDCP